LDLSNIENLRRRGDGHLVIMDPFSLWELKNFY
jgi:hypothetical protein